MAHREPTLPGFFTVVSPELGVCRVTWLFRLNLPKADIA
jgi:hypothetical protein